MARQMFILAPSIQDATINKIILAARALKD